MQPSTRGRPARLADAAAAAGVWAFVSFGSTAQRWTGLDTPDSEFYATLGLFGHDVTDRAAYPVYYWTRFGTILPVRALTALFGSWPGYHVFWLVLVAAIVAATFVLARRFTTRFVAALLAALVSLNTVVLGMLGNPYVSGTAMAATMVLIAAVAYTLPVAGARAASRFGAPVVAGLALGWLAMTNPYATMLATAVWVAATLVVAAQWPTGRIAYLARSIGLGVVGAALSFGALLLAGRLVFPGMDWLATNVYWSRVLNSADYVTDVWSFRRDIVFVVPAVALASVVALWATRRRDPVLRLAAVLAPASVAYGLGFLVLSPSNTFEVPHYQALQWIPALAGLVLAVAAVVGRRPAPWWVVAIGAVAVVATVVAGHWTGTLDLRVGWALGAVLAVGFVATTARAGARADDPADLPAGPAIVSVVVAAGVLFAGFQVLQNSHRPLTTVAESPYANAFTPNDVFAKLDSAQRAQRWLVDSTTSQDTVLVWVDADWGVDETLLPMAAFQLWGANQVTPLPSLYGAELDRARDLGTDVIAMYGRTKAAIWRFWGSLPPDVRRSDPRCTDYPWPNPSVSTAYVCLTRITWR